MGRNAGIWVLGIVAIVCAVVGRTARVAHADDPDNSAKRERCAIRLAIAITGRAPDATLMGASDPESQLGALLATPEFVERFARFVNAYFNSKPGSTAAADAPYWVAHRVLADRRPWKDLFTGPFNVDTDDTGNVVVKDDPDGLGYFRSLAWLKRYAGNETSGVKLVTANRMMKNTIGLQIVPTTTAPGQDVSATGRQASPCRSCHYDPWFALDKVASILTRRVGTGDSMTFVPPTAGPQTILDGQLVADDKGLIATLVSSPQFTFNQCRMAFNFLYGRDENACEGKLLDECVDALSTDGTIQAALTAIAKDTAFCD